MRITLKKPPKERADRFERAGALAGRAIGSLPVGIRRDSRTPSPPPTRNAALVAGPVLAAAAVAAALKKRSRSAAKASEERAAQTPIENDDTTLARKVETEIFRSPDVPKGDIVVNAAFGRVTLRGSIGDADLGRRLATEAGQVPGVKSVENLLHTPWAEAPTAEPEDPEAVKARLSANGAGEST